MKKKILTLILTLISLIFIILNNDNIRSFLSKEELVSNNEELVAVRITKVVDGDTLTVTDGNKEFKVRLNLINTPESVHSDESKNNEFGIMASDFVKSLIHAGDTVYLQYDTEKEDKYGRALAYVWLSDNVVTSSESDIKQYMLNAIILDEGYGKVVLYNNKQYYDLFMLIEAASKDDEKGLWKYEGYKGLY